MTNYDVLINLTLGGLLGVVGQGIRVIIGLKKLQEEAKTVADAIPPPVAVVPPGASPSLPISSKAVYNQLFDSRKLWLSLFIGFIAGCLASLVQNEGDKTDNAAFSNEVVLGIIAAGYAGTDFIEGIFKKLFPGS